MLKELRIDIELCTIHTKIGEKIFFSQKVLAF